VSVCLCMLAGGVDLKVLSSNVIQKIKYRIQLVVSIFCIHYECGAYWNAYILHQSISNILYIFRSIITSLCCDIAYKSCDLPEIPVALGSKNGFTKPFSSLFRYQFSQASRVLGLWVICCWLGVSIILVTFTVIIRKTSYL